MNDDDGQTNVDLTVYELEQIGRIAAWKSAAPRHAISGLVRKVTRPGVRLLERFVPERWVLGCIEQSYQVALGLAHEEQEASEIAGDGWPRSLLECDELAEKRCSQANAVAVVQGAVTGLGGMVTTFVDIPLLLALSMQTVMRVGRCYGYSLKEQGDQKFVMGVLIAGSSGSLKIKRQRLGYLQVAQERVLGQTQEEMIAEELFALLFHMELFEEIPGLGAVTAGLLNLGFVRQVGQTAQRVFQERWLRDHRGVGLIEPSGAVTWNRGTLLGRGVSRAASSTFYCLGFTVALPASVVASTLMPVSGLLRRKSREDETAALLGEEICG
jgi:EcsC protein family